MPTIFTTLLPHYKITDILNLFTIFLSKEEHVNVTEVENEPSEKRQYF